jgi:hypothetical protein
MSVGSLPGLVRRFRRRNVKHGARAGSAVVKKSSQLISRRNGLRQSYVIILTNSYFAAITSTQSIIVGTRPGARA